MESLDQTRQAIGLAMGRIPSGCSILTVSHGGRATGTLVSWVQQASFEPPAITVAVKRGRPVAGLVDGSKRFLLNVIGEDPAPMFKQFGRGLGLEEDAFAGLAVEQTEFGPLLRGCIAHLGCRLMQVAAVGDHDLYIAEVAAGASALGSKPYVHLRHSGLSY